MHWGQYHEAASLLALADETIEHNMRSKEATINRLQEIEQCRVNRDLSGLKQLANENKCPPDQAIHFITMPNMAVNDHESTSAEKRIPITTTSPSSACHTAEQEHTAITIKNTEPAAIKTQHAITARVFEQRLKNYNQAIELAEKYRLELPSHQTIAKKKQCSVGCGVINGVMVVASCVALGLRDFIAKR
jgi:hypothetical protein